MDFQPQACGRVEYQARRGLKQAALHFGQLARNPLCPQVRGKGLKIIPPPVEMRDPPSPRLGPGIAICAIGALVRHQLQLPQRLPWLSPDAHLERATRRQANHFLNLGPFKYIIMRKLEA